MDIFAVPSTWANYDFTIPSLTPLIVALGNRPIINRLVFEVF